MNKIIAVGCMAVASVTAVAVPTENELEQARPLVENMTKSALDACNAGKMPAKKLAATHIDCAKNAKSEAEKYLLYQGAFKLYVRCKEYDLAADALQAMMRDINGIPSKVITEIVGSELRDVDAKKATRLNDMLRVEKLKIGLASKATVNDCTWSYREDSGEALIIANDGNRTSPAVSLKPTGHFTIPAKLGGAKVSGIGEHAFFGCDGLTSVTIPSGVKSIDNGAFYGCCGLEWVKIPASVNCIVPTAFAAMSSVQAFSVDFKNPTYRSKNGLLCTKDGLTLVAGVNGDVTIPKGVVTIGPQAFLGRGCEMTVVIPASVTNIEERAFGYCCGLTSVTMCGECPTAPNGVFVKCDALKAIHVPANAKSWKGMKEWQGKPLIFDAK